MKIYLAFAISVVLALFGYGVFLESKYEPTIVQLQKNFEVDGIYKWQYEKRAQPSTWLNNHPVCLSANFFAGQTSGPVTLKNNIHVKAVVSEIPSWSGPIWVLISLKSVNDDKYLYSNDTTPEVKLNDWKEGSHFQACSFLFTIAILLLVIIPIMAKTTLNLIKS